MSSEKTFVVGAVSSHGHERGHVLVLDRLPEVETVHVCATTEHASVDDMAAESSKVASTTQDLGELLKRSDLDAVTVCARADHAPAILEAVIAAGLPVLYDKPAAVHSSQLRSVADHARQRGLTAGAMLQWRYHPMTIELRRAVEDGALGRIMTIEARMLNGLLKYRDTSTATFRAETAGSGILSWLGCHTLDKVLYLMAERVVEVTAMLGNLNPEKIEVEDTGFLILRFASGAMGTFQAGYHLIGSKSIYDIYIGMRGLLGHASLPLATPLEIEGGNSQRTAGTYTLYSEAPGFVTGGARAHTYNQPETPGYGGIGAERLFVDFLKASRTGAPAPSPIEDNVHLLEIIEAAKESSSTGRAVRIEEG